MTTTKNCAVFAALFSAVVLPAVAVAQTSPTGVWIDHTGRGAVEITECNGALCGHIVWVKDANHSKTCRNQVIGDVRPVRNNTWDRGWIVDPDDNARYSVELKPMGEDRLRVVGYMGSKLFSETMTWKRAPADLKRCDFKEPAIQAAAPGLAPISAPAAQPAVVQPNDIAPATPEPVAPPQPRQAAVPEPLPEVSTQPPPIVAEPAPQRETRPRRQASGKSKNRECSFDLPFVTVKLPCDAF